MFSDDTTTDDKRTQWIRKTNPIAAFLDDEFEIGNPDWCITVEDFYNEVIRFCERNEFDKPTSRKYVTEKVLDANLGIKKQQKTIDEIKRMTIAPICPYWSPILQQETGRFKDAHKVSYNGLNNKKFTIYQRKLGCPYYEQYKSYSDADVLIFNSLKYKIETLMDRKPETELEVIDECDEFLDSFTIEEQINLNRLTYALNTLYPNNEKIKTSVIQIFSNPVNNGVLTVRCFQNKNENATARGR